ncbi:hypothetical protein C4J81_18545 [Deltaproteobacteria bacterium Smac51]|nr:hypothetical protein C4J81_18545 [Deltaproteobacteria bacterium Smac51]
MGLFWRGCLKKTPTVVLWVIIWTAALLVPWVPGDWLFPFAAVVWMSALILAPGKIYGRRLLKAAIVFALIWSLIMLGLFLAGSGGLLPVIRLWVWLGLGLHLMLAKTPLELAIPVGRLTAPVIGHIRAQKLALALALTARLIPRLLDSAIKIKASLDLRASSLPLIRRMALWGRAIMRDSFSQSEELARALVKRWPW